MSSRDRAEPPPPDIAIGAAARAKRVRFAAKPETSVRFAGSPQIASGTQSERENLPDEVEAGVTYRDVEVRWAAAARSVDPEEEEKS